MAEKKVTRSERLKEEEKGSVNLSIVWHNFVIAIRHLYWIPLVLILLGSGLQYLRHRTPGAYTYTTRAVFAVSANITSSTDILSYNYYYDNAAAKQLSATFPYVLSSDAMAMLISQQLGVEQIPGTIEASSITNAGLFVLEVTSSTPEDALTVINAVIDAYPQAASAVLGDTQLSIIDKPVLPTEPNEHYSLTSPVIKGGLIGLNACDSFISEIPEERTARTLAKHARYIADLVGIEHVACGFDFGAYYTERETHDLASPAQGQNFIEGLRAEGFSEEEIKDIGYRNVFRFLKKYM